MLVLPTEQFFHAGNVVLENANELFEVRRNELRSITGERLRGLEGPNPLLVLKALECEEPLKFCGCFLEPAISLPVDRHPVERRPQGSTKEPRCILKCASVL